MVRRVKPTFEWMTIKSSEGYFRMRAATADDVTSGEAQKAGNLIIEHLTDGTKQELKVN